jgi:hypothetical protein
VRLYIGTLLGDPDGKQFLVSVDEDTVTVATRPTSDTAVEWSSPMRLGEVADR